jgi:hypothetical protein
VKDSQYLTYRDNGKQFQAKAYGFNAVKSPFGALLTHGQALGITELKNRLNRLKNALNTAGYKCLKLWGF